ncbi:Ankyrin repeat-containing domain [Lasallia pustulata]|uniref:Ankyrin repeat-containing domain n=1 Tax=Lasallia pustulata TaxID=136370 RepID=A0A1W5CSD0_9LECA|nr:Ankyrin repeat-containing domain [Lasallia pustulata]
MARPSPQPNPLLLAADNSPHLLPLLRTTPSLASTQDPHGYSLLHAAASYNHLSLLRTLVHEFHVSPNITDEDAETPLFVVETVEAAQCLVEELGADVGAQNAEGETAEEKITGEGEFVAVADYLRETRGRGRGGEVEAREGGVHNGVPAAPSLPPNVTVNVGTMDEGPQGAGEGQVDPEFRRRIDDLAARDDFQGEEGQRQLRELISDAVRSVGSEGQEREVRRRIE